VHNRARYRWREWRYHPEHGRVRCYTVPDDIDDPDDNGGALSWWRMTFFAVFGLGLVAVIVYLYVLATGH
jgi:hypothetical protein